MKKQIALLAAIVVASGLTAFGQDWVTLGTANSKWVYDEFTTPGVGVLAPAGDIDVTILWAPTGTADQLASVAGTGYGLKDGAATDQVATNGVTSVGSANPIASINAMLAGGWSVATNISSGAGSATTGFVSEPTAVVGTGGAIGTYNANDPFELLGGTGVSGSAIEMVLLAWNASSASYTTASALGWSNPFNDQVGSSSSDPNGTSQESALLLNQFGVANLASVPEPTTLALAGLGGLSMLFLRRRKA